MHRHLKKFVAADAGRSASLNKKGHGMNVLRSLDAEGKLQLVTRWAENDDGVDPAFRARVVALFRRQSGVLACPVERLRQVFLTFNGGWGQFGMCAAGGSWLPVDDLVAQLRGNEEVLRLRDI